MPLPNRVDPFGQLFANAARGTMFGNRGGRIHDPQRRLTMRRWASQQWICCALEFKNRRREVWARLGSDLKPKVLNAIAHEITLAELPGAPRRIAVSVLHRVDPEGLRGVRGPSSRFLRCRSWALGTRNRELRLWANQHGTAQQQADMRLVSAAEL